MRRISLSALGMFLGILSAFSQLKYERDTIYKPSKLSFEEANIVSSYYKQDGNHSAVTGGIGTEKLTDFANTFELKLTKTDYFKRKHSIGLELGVDTYTSASSNKIDSTNVAYTSTSGASSSSGGRGHGPRGVTTPTILTTNSTTSASYKDTRIYPSVNWQMRDDKLGYTVGANLSYSSEYDYKSRGGSLSFVKSLNHNSQEIGIKLAAFLDTWEVILPLELRPPGYGSGSHHDPLPVDYKPRNTFSAALTFAQIINKRLQMSFMVEPTYQQGLLATKYQRVYFNNGTEQAETLPDQRKKLPLSVRANYFAGDRVVLRTFYRFYADDWGLRAHTINLETAIKLTPFFTLTPFYRFYTQNGIKYFAAYKQQDPTASYYTSDYDLSKLNSHSFGAGIRFMPPFGVLGLPHWNSIEIRYAHYMRSTDLTSNIVTLALKFK